MATIPTTRRGIIAAMAIAPIVATAAPASTPSRHGAWLAEHMAVHARLKRAQDNGTIDRLSDRMCALERMMVDTPAASAIEAREKARFALMLHREEIALDAEDAMAVIGDLSRYVR